MLSGLLDFRPSVRLLKPVQGLGQVKPRCVGRADVAGLREVREQKLGRRQALVPGAGERPGGHFNSVQGAGRSESIQSYCLSWPFMMY